MYDLISFTDLSIGAMYSQPSLYVDTAHGNNCASISYSSDDGYVWEPVHCTQTLPFICKHGKPFICEHQAPQNMWQVGDCPHFLAIPKMSEVDDKYCVSTVKNNAKIYCIISSYQQRSDNPKYYPGELLD